MPHRGAGEARGRVRRHVAATASGIKNPRLRHMTRSTGQTSATAATQNNSTNRGLTQCAKQSVRCGRPPAAELQQIATLLLFNVWTRPEPAQWPAAGSPAIATSSMPWPTHAVDPDDNRDAEAAFAQLAQTPPQSTCRDGRPRGGYGWPRATW